MYAFYSFVPMNSNLIFFCVTRSRRKWNLIGTCLVLECITGFLEMFIALVLSHSIRIGSSYFTCMSCRVFFIQRIRVQHVVVAIYFASVVDKDTGVPRRKSTPQVGTFQNHYAYPWKTSDSIYHHHFQKWCHQHTL
jgi:hypothetical protein